MDKKGIISEHSKIKLELYNLYLERYLAVLLSTPFFDSICVHDVFAGCGISKNDEKGSAVIAAETIGQITSKQNPWGKRVFLLVNDADEKNFSHSIGFSGRPMASEGESNSHRDSLLLHDR